jgi:aryl-alcohol dehydrogenase-like predicted oxidoreductase
MPDMRYRTLGRTGLEVSVLGYGAWGIGQTMWIGADDDESLRALRRAFELGVNLVDTAYGYGNGHSEELVGRAVRDAAEPVFVATKIPPKNRIWPAPAGVPAEEAFPAEHVIACTEESLARLGVDAIDVQQFHVWSDEWVGQGDWLDAVEQLKRDGKIRWFGVSINDHQPANAIRLVESGHVDTVQVIYNVFDQSPEDELFEATERAGVGVIARVPLDEGSLTGRIRPETEFPDGDFRNVYFREDRRREVWDRAQGVAADLGVEVDELAESALRFATTHPAVSCAIPGMRSTRNVERNAAAAEAGPLDAAQVAALRPHRWARNFYR